MGIPIGGQRGGGVRPYVTGGAGLLRSNISATTFFPNDFHANDFGINVGGGVHGYFNDRVGLRGDLRYFRLLQDNEPAANDLDLGAQQLQFLARIDRRDVPLRKLDKLVAHGSRAVCDLLGRSRSECIRVHSRPQPYPNLQFRLPAGTP